MQNSCLCIAGRRAAAASSSSGSAPRRAVGSGSEKAPASTSWSKYCDTLSFTCETGGGMTLSPDSETARPLKRSRCRRIDAGRGMALKPDVR